MTENFNEQEPSSKDGKLRFILSCIRRGTPYMNHHVREHEPDDIALTRHKVRSSIASGLLLGTSLLGLKHTVPDLAEDIKSGWTAEHMKTSEVAELTGHMSLMYVELSGIAIGLTFGSNAQAAYRRQQEGLNENYGDKTTS